MALPQCHPRYAAQIKATFDGQELAPTAYKWHVPIVGSWLRRTYAETLNPTPAELALPVSGASPDLVVTPGGYSAQLTITDAAGESIYDGSATASAATVLLRTAPTMPS